MTDRMSDKEKNRFSARAMRYASVGANVGGVAARIASRRLFGLDPERDKDAASLAAALGGLKGPLMKVAQLLATIPDAIPAEYAASWPAPEPGAGHGLAVRAPPHGRRAWPGLAREVPELRRAGGSGGLARPGAQGAKPRWPRAGGEAAISGDAVRGRGRPRPAPHRHEHLQAHGHRHRYVGDHAGDRGPAARGAGLRSRSAPHGALQPDVPRRRSDPRAGACAGAIDQAAADHDLARRPEAARLQGQAAGRPQRHRPRAVPRLVVSRSAITP